MAFEMSLYRLRNDPTIDFVERKQQPQTRTYKQTGSVIRYSIHIKVVSLNGEETENTFSSVGKIVRPHLRDTQSHISGSHNS